MEIRPLELEGHEGAPLPCVLYEPERPRGTCAVVLPGMARAGYRLGGTPARPDLHHTRTLLLGLGVSVLEVWWDFDGPRDEAWLEGTALAAARGAAGLGELRILVGRSMGSRALAKLVRRPEHEGAASIWIAPLLGTAEVRDALGAVAPYAFVAGGSADEAFDVRTAEELRSLGAAVAIVDGGDHGLEVGDPAASARALADVLDDLRAFAGRVLSG